MLPSSEIAPKMNQQFPKLQEMGQIYWDHDGGPPRPNFGGGVPDYGKWNNMNPHQFQFQHPRAPPPPYNQQHLRAPPLYNQQPPYNQPTRYNQPAPYNQEDIFNGWLLDGNILFSYLAPYTYGWVKKYLTLKEMDECLAEAKAEMLYRMKNDKGMAAQNPAMKLGLQLHPGQMPLNTFQDPHGALLPGREMWGPSHDMFQQQYQQVPVPPAPQVVGTRNPVGNYGGTFQKVGTRNPVEKSNYGEFPEIGVWNPVKDPKYGSFPEIGVWNSAKEIDNQPQPGLGSRQPMNYGTYESRNQPIASWQLHPGKVTNRVHELRKGNAAQDPKRQTIQEEMPKNLVPETKTSVVVKEMTTWKEVQVSSYSPGTEGAALNSAQKETSSPPSERGYQDQQPGQEVEHRHRQQSRKTAKRGRQSWGSPPLPVLEEPPLNIVLEENRSRSRKKKTRQVQEGPAWHTPVQMPQSLEKTGKQVRSKSGCQAKGVKRGRPAKSRESDAAAVVDTRDEEI